MLTAFSPEKRSIARLRRGELEGLRWIYENHAERLLNQAYRFLLSREQAEDLVQELFIKLPQIIVDFRGESGLGTWLFRIMHNLCLNFLEQSRNRGRLTLENQLDLQPLRREPDYEITELLDKALSQLDAETRSLLWLKEGDGLSLKELTVIFKLPVGTIKSRLSRARERVREYLGKEAVFEKPGKLVQ